MVKSMTKDNETTIEKDSTQKVLKKKWDIRIVLGVTLIVAALVVAAVILYQKIYYGDRWYKHTYINEIDVSGQTLDESKENLEKDFADYTLTINGRDGGSLTIDGKDIDYKFSINSEINSLYDEQHKAFRLFSKKSQYTTKFDIAYDENKLSDIVTNSEIVAGSTDYTITTPKSATVKYSSEKQQYICQEEVKGNKIISKNLLTTIKDAMEKGETTLDLTDEESYPDVYKAPKYTSESEEITTQLKLFNNAALRYISWNMGKGNVEQITPKEISQWITYKNGKIKYDNTAIEEWVEAFCLKYKTVGKTRKITSHTGKKVKIVGGDYGWQLDYEKTVTQTKNALKSNIDYNVTESYINDPSDENKKGITLKKKVVYANTAFQKDYENFVNDWDPDNYTEISIKDQKVYVFRNGKVKFSCRCITGRPVEGRRTPTGAYYIKEHKEAYTLTGADYSTPVKNWVRITWTGTGFHPATWQPWSRWTNTMYLTRGSHGCINLSVSDAQKIYDLTKYREAVFIH